MKFSPPPMPLFLAVVVDIDSDDPSVSLHKSEAEAREHLRSEYRDAPSPGEPDGNSYEPEEMPNAQLYVAQVVMVAVI